MYLPPPLLDVLGSLQYLVLLHCWRQLHDAGFNLTTEKEFVSIAFDVRTFWLLHNSANREN